MRPSSLTASRDDAPMAGSSAAPSWGIVGGGMLGLTLALRLAERGCRVTVLEAADRIGGLASAWRVGDVTWDRHYHVTLLSDMRLRSLLRDLDLEETMEWRFTRTGCYAGGRLHSVSNGLELLKFPVLGLLDKARLVATILYASRIRDGRRLEATPVGDWLCRWSGRRTFQRFWLPLLRSKLGDAYRETSAAFIWATIARLYAARRSGLKREMFGYVPGGYARVLERFAEVLRQRGVAIHLQSPVRRIASTGEGALAVELADGRRETFDRVALTAAAPIAARLCPDLEPAEHQRLEAVRYLGIVCASALLTRPLGGFYVTNLLDEGLPFTGVIEMSALVDPGQLGGRTLVYLPRYVASDDSFFEASDAEIEETFVAGLRRMFPDLRRDQVTAFRISRARHVMALSTLDYSATVPPMRTSIPGLFVVNSAQIVNGTLNVNETVQLAERAIPDLLADLPAVRTPLAQAAGQAGG